jgi:hypothetical protein
MDTLSVALESAEIEDGREQMKRGECYGQFLRDS